MTKKRRSQKQEKSVAKGMNAKVQVASGAFWGNKADVRSELFLIECKTTGKPFFNITAKIWEKVSLEAVRDCLRIPLLIVDLRDCERYVIFNIQDFECIDFEYSEGNTKDTCKSQFKFSGDTPLAFYLKASKEHWKEVHSLMCLTFEDFNRYFDNEI